jgi:hypothetical protein
MFRPTPRNFVRFEFFQVALARSYKVSNEDSVTHYRVCQRSAHCVMLCFAWNNAKSF